MGAFSGPNISLDNDYTISIFTSSGTWTPNFTGNIEVLVVAGGGGGGMDMGGGGGAGGLLTSTAFSVTAGTVYTVTVGAGGAGAPAGSTAGQPGGHQFTISATQGGNSVFSSLTAIGGGFGASSYYGYLPNSGTGGTGGSGGGCSAYTHGGERYVDSNNTAGQGYPGGNSGDPRDAVDNHYSGGGGGAGGRGTSGPGHTGPNGARADGGPGVLNSILNIDFYWAGGGGGSCYSGTEGGNGGLGGGGGGAAGGNGNTIGYGDIKTINSATNGGLGNNQPGGDGGMNTGGGGGGGSHYNANNKGGNGGSGIVIIKHLKIYTATTTGGSIRDNSLIVNYDFANPKSYTGTTTIVNIAKKSNNIPISGTLSASPSYSTDGGGSLVFSNSYMSVPSLNLNRDFTLECWVKLTSVGTSVGFFGQGPTATNQGLHIGWFPGRGLLFGMYSNDLEAPSYNMTYNTWHHFAYTYNNTTYFRQTFADGVLISSGTLQPYTGSGQFNIGANYSSPSTTFIGNMSNVKVHNKALSASEVLQNFNALRGRFNI